MALMKKPKAKKLSKLEQEIEKIAAQLSPEQRALFEEAREIRRRIGRVPFKVTDLVREIRGDDD